MTADGVNDEIARQRDRAKASLRDRDAQLDKTELCLRVERQKAAAAIRVLREDAEHNAYRAELAEQELDKVRRELRKATEECKLAAELARRVCTGTVESELSEAERGLFVPIPAGHMLSVTVTPYDTTPVEDEA